MPRSVVSDPLSWDSSRLCASPPTLLPKRCSSTGPLRPSIDLVPGVHSRADIAAVASVRRCQPPDPVPTSPILTVTPAYSADWPACTGLCAIAGEDSRACCIPLPILGFAAFLAVIRVAPAPHTGHCWSVCSRSREFRVLAARFIPLKGFPPPAAVPCLHDRCLLDVRFPRSLDRCVATVAGFDVRVSTA